jgi:hypothetical protein
LFWRYGTVSRYSKRSRRRSSVKGRRQRERERERESGRGYDAEVRRVEAS